MLLGLAVATGHGANGPVSTKISLVGNNGRYAALACGTIQRFLAAGFVDRLVITRVPVLIGAGIPLFGPVPRDIHLQHVDTRCYGGGLVQSEYKLSAPG